MKPQHVDSWLFGILAFGFMSTVAGRLGVMSIDLGGEYFKVAIVKPGVPMEIALNKESARKTPTLVAFRDGERHFASEALTTALKFPQKAFGYLMQIIGRQFDDPQVELFRQRFPYYDMLKDEERGTILFRVDDETIYSVEELLAMILEQAKDYAQDFAEQEIKDAVITVPPFYNQAERRAVISAAGLVGINVLQLMSDNAAVALNYGVFRRKNFNSTTQYYMFYDMGSTSTTATIVGYNVVKSKEGTRLESNPQLTVKGIGFDRSLGGLEFTLRLRAHLAKLFNEQKKTKLKVEDNSRAMAKLLKEAERVKKVLSANADHTAQVENLLDEKDFRAPVTKLEFEELTKDLIERVTNPIEEALKVSEITLPEITEIILMGGGTRMPKVQALLMKYLGRSELGKSINTDEAAAMGAVYQAAYLGKGFKVKKFGVREGNIYPINVEFERQKSEDDEKEGSDKSKLIKRTLFSRMNPYPQKKVMTFNKHTKDFSFSVTYSGLEFLTEDDRRSFGTPFVSKFNLLGIEDALNRNKDKEPKGIKAHFQMDGSGILTLDRVESVFEKNGTDAEEKSTWSKLGSAIGGLFGSGAAEEENKVEDSQEPEPGDDESTSGGASDDTDGTAPKGGEEKKGSSEDERTTQSQTQEDQTEQAEDKTEEREGRDQEKSTDEEAKQEEKEETTEKTSEKTEKDEKRDTKDEKRDTKDGPDGKAGGTEKVDDADKGANQTKDKGPKIVSFKEVIQTEEEILDVKNISQDKFATAKKRLSELRRIDKEKSDLEKSKNDLEAFIFDFQDKLSRDSHEKCSTEGEREKIRGQLSEASDWLYDQPTETKKADFTAKLKSLKELTKELSKRVYELEERPKALAALKSALNQTTVFLATIKNITDLDDPIFTQVELETLEKLINETKQWRDDNVQAQKKLKPYENPVFRAEDVGLKISSLDREMRYLINKAKNFKPKPKPKEDKIKKAENASEEVKSTEEVPTTQETGQQEDIPPTTKSDTQTDEDTQTPDDTSTLPDTPTTDSGSKQEKKTPDTQSGSKTSKSKKKPKSKRKETADQSDEDVLQLDAGEDVDSPEEQTTQSDEHVEL